MTTPILSGEHERAYAVTRLTGSNVTPEMVREIHIHNGTTDRTLERQLGLAGPYERIEQHNGRERLLFQDGVVHIPQISGFARRKRYEDTAEAFARHYAVVVRSLEYKGDFTGTNRVYRERAEGFVKKRFTEGIGALSDIVFGPLGALAAVPGVTHIQPLPSQYLPGQIVHVGSTRILNLGYVYGDQGGVLVRELLREYEGEARKTQVRRHIRIGMFGRVASLWEEHPVNSLLYPTTSLHEHDLLQGSLALYEMHNALARDKPQTGPNLSVRSVLKETQELLLGARDAKCVSVEMETRDIAQAINEANERYNSALSAAFAFVGHVSDLPLHGVLLSHEVPTTDGERAAATDIVQRFFLRPRA